MRRLVALLLLLGSVLVARRAMAADAAADLRSTALAFGFSLIAAVLAGGLVERLKLPRISGYLLFGLACGPFAGDLISRTMAVDLRQVNGLAISLIAFVAGLEMNLSRLREDLPKITRLGLAVLTGPFFFFVAMLAVTWPWLPLPAIDDPLLKLVVCCVASLLIVSFSPTVSIAVIAESRARGPLSSLVLALVVLTDLALIVLFTLLLQLVRLLAGTEQSAQIGMIAILSWEMIGSLAFGGIVGSAFALYLRIVGREITLVLLGLCVILAVVGRALHFEVVLASLAAGLVVENIAPPRGDALKLAVERGALPVLVVFFAAAGASLEIGALGRVGSVAVAIWIVRAALIYGMNKLAVGRSGDETAQMVWMGLVSQGGVTLGLVSLVASEFTDWGTPLYTLVISLASLNILFGPVLFRSALAKAGEVGKMDAEPG